MDRMGYMYYIQTNLTCMVILGLIYLRWLLNKSSHRTTVDMYFNRFTGSVFLICVGDCFAWCFNENTSTCGSIFQELGNIVYLVAIVAAGYFWCSYVFLKLGLFDRNYKRRSGWLRVPFIAFTLLAASNPFTDFLFSIDNGIYQRSAGIAIHWVVSWLYLTMAVAVSVRAIIREDNPYRKKEYYPFILFIVAPFLSSLVQIIWFGLSTTQVGMMISIILIYLNSQDGMINTDSLTGLNIRRTLDRYFDGYISRNTGSNLTVIMMDINQFKKINDLYGHLEGDRALKLVADALKVACAKLGKPSLLCRYGGDEFVVASYSLESEDVDRFRKLVEEGVNGLSGQHNTDYHLSVSFGSESNVCTSYYDIALLVAAADEKMYKDKAERKSRQNH